MPQATTNFVVEKDVFEHFDLSYDWWVQFYELERSDRPVPHVAPSVVPIVSSDDEAYSVWNRRRRRRAPAQRAPRGAIEPRGSVRGGVAPAVADADDVDSLAGGEGAADHEDVRVDEDAIDDDELDRIMEEAADLFMGEDDLAEGAEPLAEAEVAEPAPPTPPLPPPPEPPRRGGRSSDFTLVVEGGRITWYGKGCFEAVCANKAHGRCVKTMNSNARPGSNPTRGGRPLFFLCAWLANNGQATKAGHWQPETMVYDHATRLAARRRMMEAVGAELLATCERRREPGEGEEPEEP